MVIPPIEKALRFLQSAICGLSNSLGVNLRNSPCPSSLFLSPQDSQALFLHFPSIKLSSSSYLGLPFLVRRTYQFYTTKAFLLELQLFIAKKIVAASSRELLSFRASATLNLQLSEDEEVLRTVSVDCLHLITIPQPNLGQKKFMPY
ncbi:hypothetical protein MTR_2g044320 [Medicago truncatula]|uniref:Uncharacterized protein n=1 Tax=Medicago truncatula TaxID=3880 RepID=A0A072V6G7_MEDTR|nr:hypothetical protein MTR_2g044320 [Medicago truncatula]